MINQLHKYSKTEKLYQKGNKILIGVSGGTDSMVLLDLMRQEKVDIAVAHVNFKLRGEESDDDEKLVNDFCLKNKIPFFTVSYNTKKNSEEKRMSIQMAARELRYTFFEAKRKELKFDFIATAHHQNDLMETMLLNLVKGTGLSGLHGILPKQGKIIRPLLFATRMEIEKYAEENKIQFRTDSSNEQTKYERNKIRLEIIPLLKELNPSLENTMMENASRFLEVEFIFNQSIEKLKRKFIQRKANEASVFIAWLKNITFAKTFLFHWLNEFGFNNEQTKLIAENLSAQTGKVFYSTSHQLVFDRKKLILSPIQTDISSVHLLEKKKDTIKLAEGILTTEIISTDKFSVPSDKNICCLDVDLLEFPLLIRRWKTGDYFYPLGMKKKKKKLSNFFTDEKFSLSKKQAAWIAVSGEKICAVLSQRIDERFKITPATKNIFVIELKSK